MWRQARVMCVCRRLSHKSMTNRQQGQDETKEEDSHTHIPVGPRLHGRGDGRLPAGHPGEEVLDGRDRPLHVRHQPDDAADYLGGGWGGGVVDWWVGGWVDEQGTREMTTTTASIRLPARVGVPACLPANPSIPYASCPALDWTGLTH